MDSVWGYYQQCCRENIYYASSYICAHVHECLQSVQRLNIWVMGHAVSTLIFLKNAKYFSEWLYLHFFFFIAPISIVMISTWQGINNELGTEGWGEGGKGEKRWEEAKEGETYSTSQYFCQGNGTKCLRSTTCQYQKGAALTWLQGKPPHHLENDAQRGDSLSHRVPVSESHLSLSAQTDSIQHRTQWNQDRDSTAQIQEHLCERE